MSRSAAATAATAALPNGARAAGTETLAATAANKPAVIWYESSAPEQIARVIAAFNAAYPKIAVKYVRNTGGASIAARIIQEASANADTASFITADAQQVQPLGVEAMKVVHPGPGCEAGVATP